MYDDQVCLSPYEHECNGFGFFLFCKVDMFATTGLCRPFAFLAQDAWTLCYEHLPFVVRPNRGISVVFGHSSFRERQGRLHGRRMLRLSGCSAFWREQDRSLLQFLQQQPARYNAARGC